MPEHRAECDFCGKGPVIWRAEELKFRQWSDRGYILCSVVLPVGTCAHCQTKSLDADSTAAFDAAFQREYDKLK
jgi:hypothetical protein